jgi:hypothetical protein
MGTRIPTSGPDRKANVYECYFCHVKRDEPLLVQRLELLLLLRCIELKRKIMEQRSNQYELFSNWPPGRMNQIGCLM